VHAVVSAAPVNHSHLQLGAAADAADALLAATPRIKY
jgi:hypothetical protein